MAKNKNQEIADKFFKENPEADQVHICDDFEFAKKNAADLHKNTSGKKGLKVVSFDRKEATETKKATEPEPKSLTKMNLPELQGVAKLEDIRFDEKATKAQLVEAITNARNAKTDK